MKCLGVWVYGPIQLANMSTQRRKRLWPTFYWSTSTVQQLRLEELLVTALTNSSLVSNKGTAKAEVTATFLHQHIIFIWCLSKQNVLQKDCLTMAASWKLVRVTHSIQPCRTGSQWCNFLPFPCNQKAWKSLTDLSSPMRKYSLSRALMKSTQSGEHLKFLLIRGHWMCFWGLK